MSSSDDWLRRWKESLFPSTASKITGIDMSKGSDWSMFQVLERGKVVSQKDLDVERAREEIEKQILTSLTIPPVLVTGAPVMTEKMREMLSHLANPSPLWGSGPLSSVLHEQLQERQHQFTREYLGTFSPHDQNAAMDVSNRAMLEEVEVEDQLPIVTIAEMREVEEQEWETVARTATSTSTRRKKKVTTGRAQVAGPTTKNDPIYVWGMQSSKPRNGGEFIQYEVRLNDDGSVTCNCPGWIFKKKTETRGCKHTRHADIVKDAPDFYQRHLRGEQLPTILPTNEQVTRAMSTRAGKRAAETGKDMMQGFGRFIELED